MDFKQIQELIKLINKSDLSELKIEQDGFKITLKKQFSPSGKLEYAPVAIQPAIHAQPTPVATEPQKAASAPAENEKLHTIKSPMIGTFYRSSSPEKEPFIKVGDMISKGDHICIIEAMKLFNEIEAEVEGKVVKVLTEDAAPVEYDQPLFLVELS